MQHWHKKVKDLLSNSQEEILRDLKKRGLLLQYYSDVFGVKDLCASCPQKLRSYYTRLKNKFNINIKTMSKFLLKKDVGAKQMSFGSGDFISNDNITDEKAIEFLTSNPNRSILFAKLPNNWKELCGEEIKGDTPEELREQKVKTLANLKADELSLACKDAGINPDDYKNKAMRAEAIVAKEESESNKEEHEHEEDKEKKEASQEHLTDNEDNPDGSKSKEDEEE